MKRTKICIQLTLLEQELVETGARLGEYRFKVLKFSINLFAFAVNKRTDIADVCLQIEFGVNELNLTLQCFGFRSRGGCQTPNPFLLLLAVHRVEQKDLMFFFSLKFLYLFMQAVNFRVEFM
jgi:hypothetical protein